MALSSGGVVRIDLAHGGQSGIRALNRACGPGAGPTRQLTRLDSTRRKPTMAKLGKSKTEKAKEALGKKTKTEKARAKVAKKTDEAGKKVRKVDRKASKKTKKTIKP